MTVVIEDVSIRFTCQIHIVVMVPVNTCWSIVIELILVAELELIWKFLSWNTHESILIGEFSFGEIYRVSVVNGILSTDCYVGLIFEIVHEYLRNRLREVISQERII